jgi:hypothetical protein
VAVRPASALPVVAVPFSVQRLAAAVPFAVRAVAALLRVWGLMPAHKSPAASRWLRAVAVVVAPTLQRALAVAAAWASPCLEVARMAAA